MRLVKEVNEVVPQILETELSDENEVDLEVVILDWS